MPIVELLSLTTLPSAVQEAVKLPVCLGTEIALLSDSVVAPACIAAEFGCSASTNKSPRGMLSVRLATDVDVIVARVLNACHGTIVPRTPVG